MRLGKRGSYELAALGGEGELRFQGRMLVGVVSKDEGGGERSVIIFWRNPCGHASSQSHCLGVFHPLKEFSDSVSMFERIHVPGAFHFFA